MLERYMEPILWLVGVVAVVLIITGWIGGMVFVVTGNDVREVEAKAEVCKKLDDADEVLLCLEKI